MKISINIEGEVNIKELSAALYLTLADIGNFPGTYESLGVDDRVEVTDAPNVEVGRVE